MHRCSPDCIVAILILALLLAAAAAAAAEPQSGGKGWNANELYAVTGLVWSFTTAASTDGRKIVKAAHEAQDASLKVGIEALRDGDELFTSDCFYITWASAEVTSCAREWASDRVPRGCGGMQGRAGCTAVQRYLTPTTTLRPPLDTPTTPLIHRTTPLLHPECTSATPLMHL